MGRYFLSLIYFFLSDMKRYYFVETYQCHTSIKIVCIWALYLFLLCDFSLFQLRFEWARWWAFKGTLCSVRLEACQYSPAGNVQISDIFSHTLFNVAMYFSWSQLIMESAASSTIGTKPSLLFLKRFGQGNTPDKNKHPLMTVFAAPGTGKSSIMLLRLLMATLHSLAVYLLPISDSKIWFLSKHRWGGCSGSKYVLMPLWETTELTTPTRRKRTPPLCTSPLMTWRPCRSTLIL